MSQLAREDIQVAAERAVLVAVHLRGRVEEPGDPFEELRALAETAGAVVVGEMIQKRNKPSGRTYLGKGKVVELAELVRITDASLVIFDNDLAPSQIGAIEESTNCKVIDRSELILDIFAHRAATHAAKLQVEIAQLQYTYPRLRAMWDHLGQIVGGAPIGIGTRGPGEQQIEIDRRIVQRRKRHLRREIEEIEQRKAREVHARNLDHFTVGLVGYTNAGKSTLFNRLTEGGAYADDRLFSTLSTRTEKWNLGGGNAAMVSDTVGFIRNLPHHLVASFKSTLEDTRFAKLLIIVVDVTDHLAEEHVRTVEQTLDEIGATHQPRLLALNKIDLVSDDDEQFAALRAEHAEAIPVSGVTGAGIDRLREAVLNHVVGGVCEVTMTIPMTESRAIDFLEKRAEVLDRTYDAHNAILRVRVGRAQVDQLLVGGVNIMIDGRPALEAARDIWPDTGESAPRPPAPTSRR